eukprot:CAMPEP_0169453894 /NCGR_PEP_ID=MMETSP1042-20121227/14993_1 /TAXON_ID=464988 /ORGANISM="Hemiselmis andersenii, Strain CCMP1180" /LENGTH=276 /DNA_ID=CAMNT_0009565941 /DNA_START=448 /DNA_END=1277 /DNA_ORIENTATION=-
METFRIEAARPPPSGRWGGGHVDEEEGGLANPPLAPPLGRGRSVGGGHWREHRLVRQVPRAPSLPAPWCVGDLGAGGRVPVHDHDGRVDALKCMLPSPAPASSDQRGGRRPQPPVLAAAGEAAGAARGRGRDAHALELVKRHVQRQEWALAPPPVLAQNPTAPAWVDRCVAPSLDGVLWHAATIFPRGCSRQRAVLTDDEPPLLPPTAADGSPAECESLKTLVVLEGATAQCRLLALAGGSGVLRRPGYPTFSLPLRALTPALPLLLICWSWSCLG